MGIKITEDQYYEIYRALKELKEYYDEDCHKIFSEYGDEGLDKIMLKPSAKGFKGYIGPQVTCQDIIDNYDFKYDNIVRLQKELKEQLVQCVDMEF